MTVDITNPSSEKNPVRGILSVIDGVGTVEQIETELNHIFSDITWEWKVKKLTDKEFLVSFPSENIRRQLSRPKSFDFDSFPIKASVVETAMTEEAVDELVAVWVKIFGIPSFAREEEHVKNLAELVGEFEVLDDKSLHRDGPVRVRVACKDPNELYVSMVIYINKVGYKIRWESEDFKRKTNDDPPAPNNNNEDQGDNDDDADDLDGDDDKDNFLPRSKFQKLTYKGSTSTSSGKGKNSEYSSPVPISKTMVLCSAVLPGVDKNDREVVSPLSKQPDNHLAVVIWKDHEKMAAIQESQEEILPLSAEMFEGGDTNTNLLEMADLSGEPEKCDIPTDSDIERMRADEALDEGDHFERKEKLPAMAKRKSDRQKGQAVPVQKRAENLAKRKNLEETGLGNSNRRTQVRDLIGKYKADVVCLQETKKESFTDRELNYISGNRNFDWSFKPANGSAGVIDGFKELVVGKMPVRNNEYILTFWNKKMSMIRRYLKGRGANCAGDTKRAKQVLLDKMGDLDMLANSGGISLDQWNERYILENDLEHIYEMEELYWHKRSGEEWLLQRDRNTSYFHKKANGRRRKSYIHSLTDGDIVISDPGELNTHIVSFYKSLFRAEPISDIHLSDNFWCGEGCITQDHRELILKPFEMKELDRVINQVKNNTAPGRDGFSIHFYKLFWDHLKQDLYEMLIPLFHEELDLKRLNFGVISLIPKCDSANSIKQFRPICVLNECFKIISKVVTNRLSLIAADIISHTQTAFIPGRFILEGGVVLHEVLHVLRHKKLSGVIFKIDFEKAYDKAGVVVFLSSGKAYIKLNPGCIEKEILVREVIEGGMNLLTFRRSFSHEDAEQWNELCVLVNNLDVNSQEGKRDNLVWALDSKSKFSSKSMYNMLTFRVEETFGGGRGGDLRALDISTAGGCKASQKFEVQDWLKK
uniref:Reverse transcriptase domain-containing protein n=1 Tax=Oryza brachyantha TaxID=4533 RepID=J3M5F7_ORYBR